MDCIIRRSEFFTAYTPYQPEISQGTLQAHFEYQSMICALTGMEVANVSHYDGATAVAEAVIMALQVGRGKRCKVVLSPTLHPQYREVVRTYTQGMCIQVIGEDAPLGDLEALAGADRQRDRLRHRPEPRLPGPALHPGRDAGAGRPGACGGRAASSCRSIPISLGLFTPPGEYGADIVTGEGQPLGNALSFGGPYLGFFAMKADDVRKSAGRIVGQTVDIDGKRGFVLTLSTREQHIRREKASSNICTNQALNALAAGDLHGRDGQVRPAHRRRAELSQGALRRQPDRRAAGLRGRVDRPVLQGVRRALPAPVAEINAALLDEWGIVGGYDLGQDYPGLKDHMLLCVTEMNTRAEIEDLAEALAEIARSNCR